MKYWLCLVLLLSNPGLAEPPKSGFAFSEHLSAGDSVKLNLDYLALPNGLSVTYAQIMSFGDMFGLVGKPIVEAKSQAMQKLRFIKAFNTFANDPKAVDEVTKLNQVILSEYQAIQKAMQKGQTAEAAFKRIGFEVGRKVNCITGGGCGKKSWFLKPGRYLSLAKKNYDHFFPNALTAYQVGHQVALEQALKAHQNKDIRQLAIAYAMNAYASHFLSDAFSAGHMRTPRVVLKQQVTPDTVGSLLANYMHNEDNLNGLHVHNRRGDHWLAYGDFSYFNPNNKANREMLSKVLQLSCDEIYHTYMQGVIYPSNIDELLPMVDELKNNAKQDGAALFYWDEKKKKLYRRKNIKNLHQKKWTSHWWGWSTLAELKRHYG